MNVEELNNFVEQGDFILHYGIKGQKWGIRRYQNPDGSYTEAGKARYADGKVSSGGEKLSSNDLKSLSNSVRDVSNSVNMVRQSRGGVPHKKRDLSNMSDDDLRKVVNRMNLESQYNNLKDTEDYYSSGKAKLDKALATVSTVAITASAALAAAASIKSLTESK